MAIIHQLSEKCPDCGKTAIERFSIQTVDKNGDQCKLITLECFHIIKKIIPKATPFEFMVSNDWKPEVKNCFHKWPTKEEIEKLEVQPTQCLLCNEFKLYDFQVIGARTAEAGLASQKGFGIFDDMGLGKTVQSLAVVKFHKEYSPTLVITKSAVTFQWFKNIIRWLGPEYLAQIISTSKDYLMPGLKMYVISHDLLRRIPREKMEKLGIKCIIIDECQQIKNPDSARTKEVRAIASTLFPDSKVMTLSGTPWKNRGSEFFVALNLVDPIKFPSYQGFLDTWVDYYWEGAKRKMGGIKNVTKFRDYTSGLLIRREYDEVMEKSPFINRMKLPVQLDELSQSSYDESESEFVDWYNEFVIGGEEESVSGIEILAQMARMRHVTGLAKIPATLSFVEQFAEDTDKKLVIFVHHKDVAELMYDALIDTENEDWGELATTLRDSGIKILKYTSDLSDIERFRMQELFNNTKRAILIASTLACGEGVDLQTCADSILHERQWNPQNEDQATPGRFRRIGQLSNTVNITCPEAEGTIDEQLDSIVERKRKAFHEAMNRGESPVWDEGSFAQELAAAIVEKHRVKKIKSGKTAKTNITGKAQLKRKPIKTILDNATYFSPMEQF